MQFLVLLCCMRGPRLRSAENRTEQSRTEHIYNELTSVAEALIGDPKKAERCTVTNSLNLDVALCAIRACVTTLWGAGADIDRTGRRQASARARGIDGHRKRRS